MAHAETTLLKVVGDIAKDHGYDRNKIVLKPIFSGGANYSSKLFSITVSSPGKHDLKLFSKAAVLGEKVRSLSEIQVYEVEIIFYTKILTKFRELEIKYNIPETERLLLPKFYGGVTEYSEELMVLEDVTAAGFQSFNRHECFDWNYASTCVNTLANFHALSVAFEREYPEEYAAVVSNLKFSDLIKAMTAFIKGGIEAAMQTMDDKYRSKVEAFFQDAMKDEKFLKFFEPDRRVVLAHGDFRPSNILHKIDSHGKVQIAPVDYQMVRPGNPVMDLLFFLICGSDEQFRAKHWNQAFDYYYDSFRRALQRLGIDPDSVLKEQDYRDDVKEMLPHGLSIGAFALLIITVEEDQAPKPEDGIDLHHFEVKASDEFHLRFNALVRDYIALGIL